jgi:ferrochelatase
MPFVDGVVAAVERAVAVGLAVNDLEIVFTTHSIPVIMAESAGPAGTPAPGAYVSQHLAGSRFVVDAVQQQLGSDVTLSWQLAYQSRSGPPQMPWLEPDINDVLSELAGTGRRGVIVVPIGFVSDHVEVVWDLDNEALETATAHGLFFARVPTPGTDPRFVSALADLVEERLDPTLPRVALTAAGPAPDRCGAGCCRNLRAVQPTTAAVDSANDWPEVDRDRLLASGIDGTYAESA